MVKISLTALNIDNKVVFAHNVGRKDGPFRCTFCHSDMVLRKGEVKTHHFAHKKDSNCPYATGETMEHEMAKLNLYNLALSGGIEAKMEDVLSEHVRADLTLITSQGKIAIEFQKSGMTDEQAKLRMEHYKETGIPVIWIMLKNDNYPQPGGEHTVTTKDLIFYNLYGNIIYTLYKNDLIDVWRLETILRNETPLILYRKWIHLAQLSLLDIKSFQVTYDNLIIPRKYLSSAIDIRWLHGGEEIDISSEARDGVFCVYRGYNINGIIYSMLDSTSTENFGWEEIDDILEYSPLDISCYVPQELLDRKKKQIEYLKERKDQTKPQSKAKNISSDGLVKVISKNGSLYAYNPKSNIFNIKLRAGEQIQLSNAEGTWTYIFLSATSSGIRAKISKNAPVDFIEWNHNLEIYYNPPADLGTNYSHKWDSPSSIQIPHSAKILGGEDAKVKYNTSTEQRKPLIERREEALKLLYRLLKDPHSVVCEKGNIERNLSEFDYMGQHFQGILTFPEYMDLMEWAVDRGLVKDNGKKWVLVQG